MFDKKTVTKLVKWGVGIAFIVVFFIILKKYPFLFNKNDFINFIQSYDNADAFFIFFIFVGTIISCFFVPISWIKAASAITLGTFRGFLASLIISNLASTISFGIGRILGQDVVTKWVGKKEKINQEVIRKGLEERGFLYTIFLRNIPFIPFAIANYFSSITSISFKTFFFASFIGMIPSIFLNVYFFSSIIKWNDSHIHAIIAATLSVIYYVSVFIFSRNHFKKTDKTIIK